MLPDFAVKSCLLLIDIQKDYKAVYKYDRFRQNVMKLLRTARKKGILICHVFEVDGAQSFWIPFWEEMRGTRTFDSGEPFAFSAPKHDEKHIIKHGYDAFFKTDLLHYLQEKGVEHLYIAGLLTGVCVLNSIFSAFNNGYRITMIENCCTDVTKRRHDSIIKNYQNYLFRLDTI